MEDWRCMYATDSQVRWRETKRRAALSLRALPLHEIETQDSTKRA